MDEKVQKPIVKISFIGHNRRYEVGIQTFFKKLGVEISDDEVMLAVRKILSEQ